MNGTMRARPTDPGDPRALPRICEGIAATHQAKVVAEIQGYPVVMNDGGFDAFARETAAELGERA